MTVMADGELVDISEYRMARNEQLKNNKEDEDQARSIRLPKKVWIALDQDAERCKRSSVRQLEALLTIYYALDDVEVDQAAIKQTREALGRESASVKRMR